MPGKVSLSAAARSGFLRQEREEPRMTGKVDSRKIPADLKRNGATHKRGEFRRSVKPANSAGRSVRHCEVQSRFIGNGKFTGGSSWSSSLGRYAGTYLTREGAGIDGEKPEFRTVDENGNVVPADHKAFLKDAADDRYMIEVVLPPNDGQKIKDFEGFTGAVVKQMESDLGTKLDTIFVVHEAHDKAHPIGGPKNKHAHVLIRGVDEDGNKLWISREYLASTLRDVTQKELSAYPTNEREKGWRLGPMTEQEAAAFQKQLDEHRPARLDMLRERKNEREASRGVGDAKHDSPANDEEKQRRRDRSRGMED